MRVLRNCTIAVLIVALIITTVPVKVAARAEAQYEIILGDIIAGDQVLIAKPSQTLFHNQQLATSDTEAMAVSFPFDTTTNTPLSAGQTALPAIAQTSDQSLAGADTGFYKANWCYLDNINAGGWGLTGAAHPLGSASPAGSGYVWPYAVKPDAISVKYKPYIDQNIGNLGASGSGAPSNTSSGKGAFLANSTAPVISPSQNASAAVKNQTGNKTSNQTVKAPAKKSYQNMTTADIKNTSALDRMWRNSHNGMMIPKTYKGSLSWPSQVVPMEKPIGILKPTNRTKVMEDSLHKTSMGQVANTTFWDL